MSTGKIDPTTVDPKITRKSETAWVVELEEDPETGELIMPLPDELLAAQGWGIGDTLVWNCDEKTGEVSLTKSTE